jgi:hypothetical protein
MYQPFARPIRKRPAYSPPMLVVVIMITFEAQHKMQAIQRHCLRPSHVAKIPALEELMNAPSVMREDISCCRPGEMFHPMGLAGLLGSG